MTQQLHLITLQVKILSQSHVNFSYLPHALRHAGPKQQINDTLEEMHTKRLPKKASQYLISNTLLHGY